jgi:hypothetical protein
MTRWTVHWTHIAAAADRTDLDFFEDSYLPRVVSIGAEDEYS